MTYPYAFDNDDDEFYTPPRIRPQCKSTPKPTVEVAWVEEGKQLRVENCVYDLTEAYYYRYEPTRLTQENVKDVAPEVVICYRRPVPGAKRYFVDPRNIDGTLQPLNTFQQLGAVPPDQVIWVVNLSGVNGKVARKLLRTYLKSIEKRAKTE